MSRKQSQKTEDREQASHRELYDDLSFDELEMASTFTPEAAKEFFPVHKEDPIDTLDSPVIFECAYPGWQAGGDHYPAVPDTKEEQSAELIESVEAGAAAIHVHPRDEEQLPRFKDDDLLIDILDPVFEECGEVVTLNHTWDPSPDHIDYVTPTQELLEKGDGNKYCQGSVVLPIGLGGSTGFHSKSSVIEAVRYFEANDVKPIFQVYDTHVLHSIKHTLIDEGEATWEPYVMNLHIGKHHSLANFNDPWSHVNTISSIYNTRDVVENSIVGVYAGGRNWLPTMVQGLLQGATLIRVGIEDAYWKYPHKDELIERNVDVVELGVQLAEMLGRDVITDFDRARDILGMKYTSPR